jgi:hypothetical protein
MGTPLLQRLAAILAIAIDSMRCVPVSRPAPHGKQPV